MKCDAKFFGFSLSLPADDLAEMEVAPHGPGESFMKNTIIHLLMALIALVPGFASAEGKPNVVLIYIDDLGYGDLGCYGSERNDTPNLDQMAAEGMRMTDFYMASPICSPSRGGMMTGWYPPRIGFGAFG